MTAGNGKLEETEAAFIVRRMTELGFLPSPGYESGRVTFYKEYADDQGRRARAYAFFDKPVMGMAGMRLSNFVVNVQASFAPELEAVKRAPLVVQDDLTSVVDCFAAMAGHVPDQAVMVRDCVNCKKSSAEFYVVNGDAVCKSCVEARRTAGE